jgi:hypothetical protein
MGRGLRLPHPISSLPFLFFVHAISARKYRKREAQDNRLSNSVKILPVFGPNPSFFPPQLSGLAKLTLESHD